MSCQLDRSNECEKCKIHVKCYAFLLSGYFPWLCVVTQAWMGWVEKHAVVSAEAGNGEVCLL